MLSKGWYLTETFQIVQPLRISEDSDPFLYTDKNYEDGDGTELQESSDLTAKLQDKDDACEVSDLISAENDVPICAEFANDKWDEELMSELLPVNKFMCPNDDSDEDSNNEYSDPMEEVPSPCLKSLDKAIFCLGDICDFLEHRGYTKEANSSNALLDSLARLHCTSLTKETSITNFFLTLQNSIQEEHCLVCAY